MKTYISDIIPKIKKYSQKLDDITLLTNTKWVFIDDLNKTKIVYIFKDKNKLFISQNGKLNKSKWEYLDSNSLVIGKKDNKYLFRHGFFDLNVLALKVDGLEEYAFLINEAKYDEGLKSIDQIVQFLEKTYIKSITVPEKPKKLVENVTEDFEVPLYNEVRISNNKSLSGKYSQITIEFSDKLVGDYFRSGNGKTYYNKFQGFKVYYKDDKSAIRGLFYYLKFNKILDVDKI